MAGPKIPWTRPPRRVREDKKGCCAACLGTGMQGYAPCWDCKGTGHPHAPGPCPPVEARQCKTCLGTGELYVYAAPGAKPTTRQCWTCMGTGGEVVK